MPRKKETVIEYEIPKAPATPAAPELPDNFASQYKAVVDKPNNRGRLLPYKPLFTPPGVVLRMVATPTSDTDKVHYKEMQMQGWMPLASNLATDDEWKAKAENLVAFPYFDDRDGIVHVGPYIVMWKPEKDYIESYLNDIRKLQAPTNVQNVQVVEDVFEDKQAQVVYRDA